MDGITCIIKNKEDDKPVPYAVIKNGKYTFIVTGTYNGKTITEEKEIVVNQYKASIGLVKYDAGTWTQEEINELKAKKLYDYNENCSVGDGTFKLVDDKGINHTFGGFKVGDSRNKSVSYEKNNSKIETTEYDGWQILESKEENEKTYVTQLVHVGCPENFVHYYTNWGDGYRATYLLTEGTGCNETISLNYSTLNDGTKINVRNWDMYIDKSQKNLIDKIQCLDSTLEPNETRYGYEHHDGIWDNGFTYWTSQYADVGSSLTYIKPNR